MQDKKMVFSF